MAKERGRGFDQAQDAGAVGGPHRGWSVGLQGRKLQG